MAPTSKNVIEEMLKSFVTIILLAGRQQVSRRRSSSWKSFSSKSGFIIAKYFCWSFSEWNRTARVLSVLLASPSSIRKVVKASDSEGGRKTFDEISKNKCHVKWWTCWDCWFAFLSAKLPPQEALPTRKTFLVLPFLQFSLDCYSRIIWFVSSVCEREEKPDSTLKKSFQSPSTAEFQNCVKSTSLGKLFGAQCRSFVTKNETNDWDGFFLLSWRWKPSSVIHKVIVHPP